MTSGSRLFIGKAGVYSKNKTKKTYEYEEYEQVIYNFVF